MRNEIDRLKEKYLNKYHFVPEFTASFHSGEVVLGEIGDVKSQIVFHGEPLYTTALVEKCCTQLNKQILATADIVNMASLPVIYSAERVDQHDSSRALELFTIREVDLERL